MLFLLSWIPAPFSAPGNDNARYTLRQEWWNGTVKDGFFTGGKIGENPDRDANSEKIFNRSEIGIPTVPGVFLSPGPVLF
jgi:hypothetical protein